MPSGILIRACALVASAVLCSAQSEVEFVGEFYPAAPVSTAGGPGAASGDFDLDGVLDIAATNGAQHFWILRGDGRGRYEDPSSFPSGGNYAESLVVHDFTGDGFPDLVESTGASGGAVWLHVGDGQGGFAAPTYIHPSTHVALAALDVDGDGLQDVIANDHSTLLFLRGDGLGGFAPAVTIPTGFQLRSLVVADVDENGLPDLVGACNRADSWNIVVHRNDGAGGFASAEYYDCMGDFPWDLAVGDFSGDGHLDIHSQTDLIPETCQWRGDGNGNFFSVPVTGPYRFHMDAGDLNLDGRDDVVFTDQAWIGMTTPVPFGFSGFPTVMDVNGDRIPDVALAQHGGVSVVRTGTRWTRSPVNGLWYRRTGRTDWVDAELVATALGGHLATIRSAAENDWIRANFGWTDYFIGYSDFETEGVYRWTSGEPVTYENWDSGQPDDAGGADFCVVDSTTGLWRDEPLDDERPGIVELASDDCDGDGVPDTHALLAGAAQDANGDGVPDTCVPVVYCTSNPNSTGSPANLLLSGIPAVGDGTLTFEVRDLPANQFGYFLMSEQQTLVPLFGGSQGNLCLGLPIVRFAADILVSGPLGQFDFAPDFTSLPNQTVIAPGETWSFQCWYRDANPAPTSNTSHAAAVTFSADARPRVSLRYPTRNVLEQATQITVPVRLSRPYHQDVLVPWSESGSATPMVDWRVESPNPLVIPAGVTQVDLVITIAGDGATEANERGLVHLLPAVNGLPGAYQELVITIIDDD